MAKKSLGTEAVIEVIVSAVLAGMESLYLATHSTIVTVAGAVLVAMLTLALVIAHKSTR